ncbi:MAG TPA: hypothetical protein VGG79_06460 [Roseiarcus sp.]
MVFALATPIALHERAAFYEAVAIALENCPERGPGAVHRIARTAQASVIADLRIETSLAAGREARHLAPRRT